MIGWIPCMLLALGLSPLDEAVALAESGRHAECVQEISEVLDEKQRELASLEKVAAFIGRGTPELRRIWWEHNLDFVSADITGGRVSAFTLLKSAHGPLQERVEGLLVALRAEEGGVSDIPLLVEIGRLSGARLPSLEALARRRLMDSGSRPLLEFALTRDLIREAEAAVALRPRPAASDPGRPSPLPLWTRRVIPQAVHEGHGHVAAGERVAVSGDHVALLDFAGSLAVVSVLDAGGRVLQRGSFEVPPGLSVSQGRLALSGTQAVAILEWRRPGSFLPERSDLVGVGPGGSWRHDGILGRSELSVAAPVIHADAVVQASAEAHSLGLSGGSILRRIKAVDTNSGETLWTRVIGESASQLLQHQEVPRIRLDGEGLDILWGGASCLVHAPSGCLIEAGTSMERLAITRLGSDGGVMEAGGGSLQWGRSGVSFMLSGRRMRLSSEPVLCPPAVGLSWVAILTSQGLQVHRLVEPTESALKIGLKSDPRDISRWCALALMGGELPPWPEGEDAWRCETFAQFLIPLILEYRREGKKIDLPRESAQAGAHPMFRSVAAWIEGREGTTDDLLLQGDHTLTALGFRRALGPNLRPQPSHAEDSSKRVRQFDSPVWPEASAGLGLVVGSGRVLRLADGRVVMLPADPLAVGDGCVLIQQGSNLVRLDLKPDGSPVSRWSCPDVATVATNHLWRWSPVAGETLLFPDLIVIRRGGLLRVLDSETGQLLWSRRVRSPATRVEGYVVWVGVDGYELTSGCRVDRPPPPPKLPVIMPESRLGKRSFRADGAAGEIVELDNGGSVVGRFSLGFRGRVRALEAKGDDLMAVVECEDGRGRLIHIGISSRQASDLTPEDRDFDALSSGRRFIAARARQGEHVVFVYD